MRKERAVKRGRLHTMEVSADQLQKAVESQHGGKAVLVSVEPVKEVWQGKTVWEGAVPCSTWRAIPGPPGPMPGRTWSGMPGNGGGSLPCCIWAGYGRRSTRCGRLSWRSGGQRHDIDQPYAVVCRPSSCAHRRGLLARLCLLHYQIVVCAASPTTIYGTEVVATSRSGAIIVSAD